MKNLNRFYTYAYLREDGTPYYIGKGSGKRLYHRKRTDIKPPKDRSRIIFLKQNLSEEEAFKHEIYMIAVFGRKDLGTGILHNKTNGGEGSSGRIMPEEERKYLSKKMTKYTKEEKKEKAAEYYRKNKERILKYYKEKYKKIKSDPEKMEIIRIKKRKPKDTHKTNRLWKTWKITFENGKVIEMTGLYNWCKENGYSDGLIYQVAYGKRNRHKDIVAVERLDTVP